MKALIIGGVAAGMSAASKLRRLDRDAEIIVLERSGEISYGACGLPYYVAGYNNDPDTLRIRSVEDFARENIEVRPHHQALRVDPSARQVMARNLESGGLYSESYDALLLATGAEAVVPSLPGSSLLGLHTLKTIGDAERLRESVEAAEEIAVIGGGFIGVEVAESLAETGRRVRLIEAAPHILGAFDEEIREILRERLVLGGARVHVGEPLEELIGDAQGHIRAVRTRAGEYPAQAALLALGVRPSTGFVADLGLRMLRNGAIETDRAMRTNLPDIYAAGDCAAVYDRVALRNVYSALGTVANKCGRIAGENMAGGHALFAGSMGSAAIAVCGLEAGRVGLGEETARAIYGELATSFIETYDRPPYYPGRTKLWVKLVCEKRSGRVLGGQVVGEKGAVLRADALALAIAGGMDARELGGADLAYAPPFAEVWDALHIAANTVK